MACLRLAQKIGKGEYPSSQKEMVPTAIKTLHLTLDLNRLDTDVRIYCTEEKKFYLNSHNHHLLALQPMNAGEGDENQIRPTALLNLARAVRKALANLP